ncbi:helix-turn-helix domain-containing protein [Rhizobium sp.]
MTEVLPSDGHPLRGFCEARPTAAGAFCDVVTGFSGRAGLLRIASSSMAFNRRLEISSSGVDHIAIHVLISGMMMWRQFDRPRQVGAGSVVVTDLAAEFGCASSEHRAEWAVLLLNRHEIGTELLAPLSDRPTILEGARPLVAALHGFMAGFAGASPAGSKPTLDGELNACGDIVTTLLQQLLRDRQQGASAKASSGQSKVLQICRHIDEHLASPKIAPETLARDFGLSRASLYRMFEPLGGVARYIRLQKIARAAVQLKRADVRVPLSTIAQSSGFSSDDAFVRAFRESFGITPRDYRSMQAGASASDDLSVAGWLERNYFWKMTAPRPGDDPEAGAQIHNGEVDGDYATAEITSE